MSSQNWSHLILKPDISLMKTCLLHCFETLSFSSLTKHISNSMDVSIGRICAIGAVRMQRSSMRGTCTLTGWQFGVQFQEFQSSALPFYEYNDWVATVTSKRYLTMIQDFFLLQLEGVELEYIWFQQDGATAHTARVRMYFFQDRFPRRIISWRGALFWPLVILFFSGRIPKFFCLGFWKPSRTTFERTLLKFLLSARKLQKKLAWSDECEGCHLSDILFKT